MKKLHFAIVLHLLLFPVSRLAAQDGIDAYSRQIDAQLANGKLTEKAYPQMSHCGGSLKGYYRNDTLVLIKTDYGGELGSTETSYYIRDSSLLKADRTYKGFIPPADWKKFCEENKDSNGNCNYNLLEREDTRTIVKWSEAVSMRMQNNNKRIPITEQQRATIPAELKDCYSRLLSELKRM